MSKEIRTKFKQLLTTITKANGYSFDRNVSQIFTAFDQRRLDNKTSTDYPKMFVITDKGESTDGTSSTKDRKTNFLLVLIMRAPAVTTTPEQLADLIDLAKDDLDLVIDRNRELDGLCHCCRLVSFTTDSGFCFPEAVVVAHVEVEELNVHIDD